MKFSLDIWEKICLWWQGKAPLENGEDAPAVEREMLRLYGQIRRALCSGRQETWDVEAALRQVNARINHRLGRRWYKWVGVAAVLMVGLGVSLLWLTGQEPDGARMEVAIVVDSILPGTEQAELVLADGSRVVLDSKEGECMEVAVPVGFVNDREGGVLNYEGVGDAPGQELAYNSLNVPKGGEYALRLPDGSQVWLNSETSLRFPVRFARDRRDVYLEGEGYFEVAKNAEAPFYVHVKGGEVKVLGTRFNVSAYADDREWETTLVEGKVQAGNDGKQVVMQPNQQYRVDYGTGEGRLLEVEPELYTSWVKGEFHFNAYPFEDIVRKLERWYDFTMVYEEEGIRQRRFSGTINKHYPLEKILGFLEKTTDIHFEIKGKQVTVSKREKG